MRFFRIFGATLLLAPLIWVADGAGEEPASRVTGARIGVHPSHTRFVIELSEAVQFDVFPLANPPRLVIDFPHVEFAFTDAAEAAGLIERGVVAGYRYGRFAANVSRLVLDLSEPARVRSAFVLPPADGQPARAVIDLEPVGAEAFREEVRTADVPAAAESTVATPPALDGGYTVVIDAGHGGIDPGATGVSGVFEKEITLDAALALAEKLSESGRFRVMLTRDSDIVVPLRDRVAIARLAGADLFLSLHADSISVEGLRGAHVYSLSDTASDAVAAELAAQENKADLIAGVDLATYTPEVGTILLELTQRETQNVSIELARQMIESLRQADIRLLRRPHRQAGFAVLKAPDVPSLLIELGFLSNQFDEDMLTDETKLAPILDAIVEAVHGHFEIRMAGGG